jgi:hypothetical protein
MLMQMGIVMMRWLMVDLISELNWSGSLTSDHKNWRVVVVVIVSLPFLLLILLQKGVFFWGSTQPQRYHGSMFL